LDFITVVNVFWLILVASVVHVLEEYFGGFVDMMQKYGPIRAISKSLFVAVNAVFIFLCILAVVINASIPTYSLSIAALIFINSFIHIGGAVRVKGYAAGLVSAVFLYIPLSVYAYVLYVQAGLLNPGVFFLSFALGVGWMGLAVAFGLASGRRAKIP
jgi:hypothetical protein